MYQQINEQFAAATRQFADTAAQINRLALANAEAVFGLQMAALGDRMNATFAFFGEAVEVRDADGLKTLWPKGVQVARENVQTAVSTGQDILGRSLKTQESIAEIAKGQIEVAARKTNEVVRNAESQFKQAGETVSSFSNANSGKNEAGKNDGSKNK